MQGDDDNRARHRRSRFFQVHGVDAAGQVVVRQPVEASVRSGVLSEVTA